MANEAEIEVEMGWVYLPTKFFDEKILLERPEYTIEIEQGHIKTRMNEGYYSSRPALYDSLTEWLNMYFHGLNLVQRKTFSIHRSGLVRFYPDGRSDTTLVIEDMYHKHSVDHIELSCTDDEGQVHDSRRERIDATKKLAELSAKHHEDRTARKILNSFYDAFKDPGNEFVYLLEIWEALRAKLQGRNSALAILEISEPELDWLYVLTCKKPLKQGRHRGRSESLREATLEELDEARTIVRNMIIMYLQFLEAPAAKS